MSEDLTLNQEDLTDLPEDFFGDSEETTNDVTETEEETPSEPEEETEKAATEEVADNEKETSPEETPVKEQEPFLTIRYNKEDVNLTREEAIELSQKGRNYDHLNEKYSGLNETLTRLSRANNMSVENYLKNLESVQENFEINKEVEALAQAYPNADKELLKEVAVNRVNERKTASNNEIAKEESNKKAEISRQVDIFEKRYPNVDPSKLEKGVYDLMREGYTLLEAYESVQTDKRIAEDKRKAELEKIQAQNNLNKAKSYGNTANVGDVEKDDFITAFMSAD